MGKPNQLYLLAVESDDNSLLGIAPLMRREIVFLPKRPLRQLTFIGRDASDYLDFLYRPGYEDVIADGVCRYLQTYSKEWDILDLTDIPEGSSTPSSLHKAFDLTYQVSDEPGAVCPYIPLGGTWDEYLSTRSSKFRKNVLYYRKLFINRLKGRFRICQSPTEVEAAIERLFALNSTRRKEEGSASPFSEARFREFHREVAATFLDRGWLRCACLEINDCIAAVDYGFRYDQKSFGYSSGFDATWAKFGLGGVILGYSIEAALRDGINEFDLLRGDELYKYGWTSHSRQNKRITVLQRHLPVLLSEGIRSGWRRVHQRVKDALPRDLRRSLKRALTFRGG